MSPASDFSGRQGGPRCPSHDGSLRRGRDDCRHDDHPANEVVVMDSRSLRVSDTGS
jgi:hypothetical protein